MLLSLQVQSVQRGEDQQQVARSVQGREPAKSVNYQREGGVDVEVSITWLDLVSRNMTVPSRDGTLEDHSWAGEIRKAAPPVLLSGAFEARYLILFKCHIWSILLNKIEW